MHCGRKGCRILYGKLLLLLLLPVSALQMWLLSTHLTKVSKEMSLDLEPLVDRSPTHSNKAIVNSIRREIPSLPLAFWFRHRDKKMYKNATCAKYPDVFDLQFNNVYWQVLITSNETYNLFGAYLDVRRGHFVVRILGMINRIEPTVPTYCQLWFHNKTEPLFAKVVGYKLIWYKEWGYKEREYEPYLISCRLKRRLRYAPSSVSLVERPCDTATNNLRIFYNTPAFKQPFAVCVKGLDFLYEDRSVRLVEWMELLGILGAHKVFFYVMQAHPNVTKVLNYYAQLGRAEVTPLTLAGGQPNIPGFQHMYLVRKEMNKRKSELIPYNDCFYKNMYSYEYIALLDVDEVILPVQTDTWNELITKVRIDAFEEDNIERSSFCSRNVYFLEDVTLERSWFYSIPRYMHMLQHVYRSRNFTKPHNYVKCFMNTNKVLTLHNHYPMSCVEPACIQYDMPTKDAQLQHYRPDCVKGEPCEEFRKYKKIDTTIWKYKDKLIQRTVSTLQILGYFDMQTNQ